MPELPEVENARRVLLRSELPGRSFTRIQVGWAPTVKLPSLEDFVLGLHSRRVLAVNRRGKYILLPLDSDETFIIHLGMTGGVSVQPSSRELDPMDPRKFGHLWLAADLDEALPVLGPEPLSDDLTVDYLAARFRNRHAPVKALLLEQSVVAGLGNLYVDESLYLARVNPARPAGSPVGAGSIKGRHCRQPQRRLCPLRPGPGRILARSPVRTEHLDNPPQGRRSLPPLRRPHRRYARQGQGDFLLPILPAS